jgi:DNA-binding PucR family transcriptional regulator
MELARLRGAAETELRLGRDLIDFLLSEGDEETALARAQVLGYDLARPHRVAVVDGGSPTDDDAFFHAVRRAARDVGAGTLLTARGDTVVVLCTDDAPWDELRATITAETGGRACRLGVGGTCAVPGEFPRSHHEALLALKLQDVAGAGGASTRFDDLGVYRVLADTTDSGSVERFVSEWLGPLFDYDETGRADLVATLTQYLDTGRSHEATAAALAVHRSTLKYRLQRIEEIAGVRLSDPDTSFNLQLATRAWRTLQALRNGGAGSTSTSTSSPTAGQTR